jgi:hypothetical protein
MTSACDREITPWPPPLLSASRSAVRAPRMPGAGAFDTWNRQATQPGRDRRPGQDRRYIALGSLCTTAPCV